MACAALVVLLLTPVSASGAIDFNVTQDDNGYLIGDVSKPTLNLLRGQTYSFQVETPGNPFRIQTVPSTYDATKVYDDGIDGIDTGGIVTGGFGFTVPDSAPDTLYYVSKKNANFGGQITITSPQAALIPEFGPSVRTVDGFTIIVTNYDSEYSFTSASDFGTVISGNPSGSTVTGTVTGLAPGQQATVTVTTTRDGYATGTATLTNAALGGVVAVAIAPSVTCIPHPAQVGALVTCTVTGGDAGIEILWRAAYNPTFAEAGVTLDASGSGEFSFVVPAAAFGQPITVELVDWAAPVSMGVAGGPVPTSVPSGGGPVPVWPLGLLALAGVLVLRRRAFGPAAG